MSSETTKFVWLSGFAVMLSLIACYGTQAVIALLGRSCHINWMTRGRRAGTVVGCRRFLMSDTDFHL